MKKRQKVARLTQIVSKNLRIAIFLDHELYGMLLIFRPRIVRIFKKNNGLNGLNGFLFQGEFISNGI